MSVALLLQIFGALLVLGAFIAVATGRGSPDAPAVLLANAVGATILAIDAWIHMQWGFLLLEVTWAIVSVHTLLRRPT